MSCIRELSFEVEKRCGVKPEVIDVVRVLYGETSGRYETEWGMTQPVPVQVGVGQGCVAAPVRSKLVLGVMQRALTRLSYGYRFTGAAVVARRRSSTQTTVHYKRTAWRIFKWHLIQRGW